MSILASKSVLSLFCYVTFDNKIMHIDYTKGEIEIHKIMDNHECEIVDIHCFAKCIIFLDEYGRLFHIFNNNNRNIKDYEIKLVGNYCFKKIIVCGNEIFCANKNDNKFMIIGLSNNEFCERHYEYEYITKNMEFTTLNEIDWDSVMVIKGKSSFMVKSEEYFYFFNMSRFEKICITKINKIDHEHICIGYNYIIVLNENNIYMHNGKYFENRVECKIPKNIIKLISLHNERYANYYINLVSDKKTYLCVMQGIIDSQPVIKIISKVNNSNMLYQEMYVDNMGHVIYFNHDQIYVARELIYEEIILNPENVNNFNEDNLHIEQENIYYIFKDEELPKYFGIRKKGAHTMI